MTARIFTYIAYKGGVVDDTAAEVGVVAGEGGVGRRQRAIDVVGDTAAEVDSVVIGEGAVGHRERGLVVDAGTGAADGGAREAVRDLQAGDEHRAGAVAIEYPAGILAADRPSRNGWKSLPHRAAPASSPICPAVYDQRAVIPNR